MRFCTADTLYTPSISGFDAADTPALVLVVLLLLILPVLSVFRPCALLKPPALAVRNVLDVDTPSILQVRSILAAFVKQSYLYVRWQVIALSTLLTAIQCSISVSWFCNHRACISLGGRIGTETGCDGCSRVYTTV